MTLTISFGKSSSTSFSKAVKRISSFPGYNITSDDYHQCSFTEANLLEYWKAIKKLWGVISAWKSSSMTVDDIDIDNPTMWHLDNVHRCYEQTLKYGANSKEYCSDYRIADDKKVFDMPCKMIKSIVDQGMPIAPYSSKYWYMFGTYDSDANWVLNKEKMIDTIICEINEKYLYVCPFFNIEEVKRSIEKLPDKISLVNSTEWEPVFEEIQPNSGVKVLTNIKRKEVDLVADLFTEVVKCLEPSSLEKSDISHEMDLWDSSPFEVAEVTPEEKKLLDIFGGLDEAGKAIVLAKAFEELRRLENK